jgi:ATP-dependent exoDNAse (exonuclease V) beta subunit
MSSTQEQLSVIANPTENKLVIALPGSGKTHTTVSLAEVITLDFNNTILMLTFTNAAATEMGERVAKRLAPKSASRVQSMTFAKLLLQQFRPMSQGRKLLMGGEQENYIRRTAAKLKVGYDSIPIFAEFVEHAGRMLHLENDNSFKYRFYIEYLNLLAHFNRMRGNPRRLGRGCRARTPRASWLSA